MGEFNLTKTRTSPTRSNFVLRNNLQNPCNMQDEIAIANNSFIYDAYVTCHVIKFESLTPLIIKTDPCQKNVL